jgi:hypothetical protein
MTGWNFGFGPAPLPAVDETVAEVAVPEPGAVADPAKAEAPAVEKVEAEGQSGS